MKIPVTKTIVSLLTLCGLIAATGVNAQTVLTVDPNQSFVGYMNVFELPVNGSGYDFGTSWGVADLRAHFAGTNLYLQPCTNVWETSDTYWVQSDGVTPNKVMDASLYVQNDALTGSNVVFVGLCVSNVLVPEPLTGVSNLCSAFIKVFDANYSVIGSISTNMVTGQAFSLALNPSSLSSAAHVQYGFESVGPDASPTEAPSLGQVVIAQYVPPIPIPVPTNNAATPTKPASSVLSLYNSSGVYTNHLVETFSASFSSANESVYTNTVTGRLILKYSALQYAGVTFYDTNDGDNVGGTTNYSINASAYDTFHVDIWTPNANQFGIKLVSLNPTEDPEVDILPASGTITSNNWVSLNIPLSYFLATNSSLNLADLQQLLWIDNLGGGGATGGIFYMDNIYFYNSAAVAGPTIAVKVVSGAVQLSFPTVSGSTYTVQYKTNLTDATWQTLSSVSGNGSTQTVPDTANQTRRFYRVYVH